MAAETPFDQEMARDHLQRLIDKKPDIAREYTITDLLHKIDPSASIDALAEELILDVADDFIDSIVTFSAEVAKNRGSPTLTAEDVNFVIQSRFGTSATGGQMEIQKQPDYSPTDAHLKRMKAVQEAQQQHRVDFKNAPQ